MSSLKKSKIIIGKHNLDCSDDDVITARYTNGKSERSDGVHMNNNFGRRAFTRSLLRIIRNQVQTIPVHSQPKATQYKYDPSVSDKNRFSVFNTNQGNQ